MDKKGKSPKISPENVAKGIQDSIMKVKIIPKGDKLYEAVKKEGPKK